jgi:hypothetical protein
MKKLLLLSIFVLFYLYANNLFAAPIEIRIGESNYKISGYVAPLMSQEMDPFGYFEPQSFSYSANAPLYYAVYAPSPYGGAAICSAGQFYVDLAALSSPSINTHGNGEAEWIFTPLQDVQQYFMNLLFTVKASSILSLPSIAISRQIIYIDF